MSLKRKIKKVMEWGKQRLEVVVVIDEIYKFKYLESFVSLDGGYGLEVKHKIKCNWMKWRKTLGVL